VQENKQVVTANTTGNFDSADITALGAEAVTASITTTVGSTPTVTAALQGSLDRSNWCTLDSATITTATTTFLRHKAHDSSSGKGGVFKFYRIDFSANTNVTVTAAWLAAIGAALSSY
jgi:hypothetical protein